MSVALEKVKHATERYMLVRLNPARYIEPVLNGSVYELTLDVTPNRLERNGVALTEVATTPTVNDTWYYSGDLLQVKLASAPSATTNVITANYYIYYTADTFRAANETPTDTSTPMREWQPRLETYPAILQSFSNILNGVFTISDVAIIILNEDHHFQNYLSDEDSFFNKDVDIWLCINGSVMKSFSGTIQSLNVSSASVRVRTVDRLKILAQSAFMGDTANECYFRRNASSFPTLDPNAHDTPCPYVVGYSSRYKTTLRASSLVGAPDVYFIDDGNHAVCTGYNSTISTTTNREWGLCRLKGSIDISVYGAVQAALDVGNGYLLARLASISLGVHIGDTIKYSTLGTTYWGIVNYIGSFTYSSVAYNIIFSNPEVPMPFDAASTIFAFMKSIAVVIKSADEQYWYPMYLRDYIATETTTSGGNKYIKITFVNAFEANHAGLVALNPQVHRVMYRTSNDNVQTHGEQLEDMLNEVGFTAEATSFAAADAALPVDCRFQIPYFDEAGYKNYLDYAKDILASTLGFLKINEDDEVEYHLLAAPSSSDTRDSSLVVNNTLSCAIEYQDIVTQLIAYNPHNDSQPALDGVDTPADTRENVKAKYLHGFVNVNRFRHVLEELTTRIDAHINLKSMRSAVYTFDTATQDIDTQLGDDFQLEHGMVIGGVSDVKVQSIQKSPGRIAIEATDLRGL